MNAPSVAAVLAAGCPEAPPPQWLDTCRSTNEIALARLAAGAPHGTLVGAGEQTAGRGRHGRPWHSPAGLGLYASLVVRGTAPLETPTLLVAAAGLGVAEGAERASGTPCRVKWPNDVWCDESKLAGILVETRGFDPARPAFVVGFGVNVNHGRTDFPPDVAARATSLALRTGRRHELQAVLAAILQALLPRIGRAMRADRAAAALLERDYRARSLVLGRRVSLTVGGERVVGVVEDVSPSAGLALRTDSSAGVVRIRAEHVSEVRLEPTR